MPCRERAELDKIAGSVKGKLEDTVRANRHDARGWLDPGISKEIASEFRGGVEGCGRVTHSGYPEESSRGHVVGYPSQEFNFM